MLNLKNAVVVITGASSGIGAAAARAFAERGAKLVLAARNLAALTKVAEECKQLGTDAVVIPTDVTDAAAVIRLAQAAAAQFGGRIDVWVNNAGIGAVGEFTETPIEAHERVIRTNLMGYLHGAYSVLPYFKRQGAGVLINNNSLGGFVPPPFAAAYAASKFGLRGFSEALRGELLDSPRIHICDVFPAFIDTPGLSHAANYAGKEVRPVPPLYDPHDVARAMVSLAQKPRRSTVIGAFGTFSRVIYFLFPSLVRNVMGRFVQRHFSRAISIVKSDGNLFEPPADEPSIFGGWRGPKKS